LGFPVITIPKVIHVILSSKLLLSEEEFGEIWKPLNKGMLLIILILKWVFKKWDGGAWTGLIWLRLGTGGGLL
jgi:hypothetical protein